MEDSETLCDVVEVVCMRVSVVRAATIDDGFETYVDGAGGHVGRRGWRPWLGWKEGLAGSVEVSEGRLGESKHVFGERLDVESIETVL